MVGVAILASFDRDRSFYPTVLIVIASYHVMFAVMGASGQALVIRSQYRQRFLATRRACLRGIWLVAAAIVGHQAFDLSIRDRTLNLNEAVFFETCSSVYFPVHSSLTSCG